MASNGDHTSGDIAKVLKKDGISVTEDYVRRLRIQYREDINAALEEQDKRARAIEPLSLMENRIIELRKVVEAEWARKRKGEKPSHYNIIWAISEIRKEVNEHESLRQRWWAMIEKHRSDDEATEEEAQSVEDEARERYTALLSVLDDAEKLGAELLEPDQSKESEEDTQ